MSIKIDRKKKTVTIDPKEITGLHIDYNCPRCKHGYIGVGMGQDHPCTHCGLTFKEAIKIRERVKVIDEIYAILADPKASKEDKDKVNKQIDKLFHEFGKAARQRKNKSKKQKSL